MAGPSWMILAIKHNSRDSEWMKEKILPTGSNAFGSQGWTNRGVIRKLAAFVSRLLGGTAAGADPANVWFTVMSDSGTKPTGNIACVQANAAGDSVIFTYGALTITLTEGTDFLRGASNTTCAANLAEAINNHAVLGNLVTALGSVGNCGLTGLLPTALLHDVAMSTGDATAFTFTQLTGGTEGAAKVFLQAARTNTTP